MEKWFGFVLRNFVGVFRGLLKVNIYSWAAMLVGLILAGLFAWVGVGSGVATIAFFVIAGVVLAISILVSRLFSLAAYKIVHEQHTTKRSVSILDVAARKARTFIGYLIVVILLFAIAMVPFGVTAFLASGTTEAAFVIDFVEASAVLIIIIMAFFLQFSLYEMVVADKGVFECIINSVYLVKRNFIETIVFYLVKAAIEWIVEVPFMLLLWGLFAVGLIVLGGSGILIGMAMAGAPIALLAAALAFGAVFFIGYMILYTTVSESILLPLVYRYWTTLKSGKLKGSK